MDPKTNASADPAPVDAEGERPHEVVIVVPCYNEAARLDSHSFLTYALQHPDVGFVLVDDGSQDGTLQRIRHLRSASPSSFHLLHLPRNVGKGEAVRRGVLQALEVNPAFVGYWDADLATPLEAIDDFRATIATKPHCEIVIGSRVKLLGRRIERSAWRHYCGRAFATLVSAVLRLPVYDTQCGAKLFRTSECMRAVFSTPFYTRWIFDVEIIARLLPPEGQTRALPAEHIICELPLMCWQDAGNSKLTLLDAPLALWGLLTIRHRYGLHRSGKNSTKVRGRTPSGSICPSRAGDGRTLLPEPPPPTEPMNY